MTEGGTRAGALLRTVPAALLAIGAVSRAWIADDGLIYVRVAEVALAGGGPSFNELVRTETATGPLWLLALVIGGALTPIPIDLLAVGAGALCAVGAMWFGVRASVALLGAPRDPVAVAVPLGLLALALWPTMWDFSTAGLEMGAVLLWLGWCARRLTDGARPARAVDGIVFGLGPLLRPELAIVSAVFLLTLVSTTDGGRDRRRWVVVLGAALALPMAWQVFRMGWFGSLVPIAGLAKEGSKLWPGQGLRYVWRSLADGAVVVAVVVGLVLQRRFGATRAAATARFGPRRALLLAGALHLLYVVAIGGDFMRGRLLLPGMFLLAVAVGTLELALDAMRWVGAGLVAVLVVGWAGTTSGTSDVWHGIVDERGVWVFASGDGHPVSERHYDDSPWAQVIERTLGTEPPGSLLLLRPLDEPSLAVPLAPEIRAHTEYVVVVPALGAVANEFTPDTWVIDPLGLADPLAAHLRVGARTRPGHEKRLPDEWYVAWLGDPDAVLPPGLDPARVEAARHAIGCGDLAEVVEATTGPMDLDRFLSNLRRAASLTRFRFDPDPVVAEAELCS